MAEPTEPHDIARHTFAVARRGYEQQEVRGFLHEVSAVVERLTRLEREHRERADRAEAKLGAHQHPDEAVLLEVLGEETTRVLTSAREAASEIRAKAEEAAARIIAEATAGVAAVRADAVRDADALLADAKAESESTLAAARAELERRSAEAEEVAARIRADGEAGAQALRDEGQADLARAREEGEAALAAARQEGRAMVAEAQAVRERVLRDLAVRRKRGRQQVEKLNAGRERLLEAYEVVKRTAGEATDELTTALTDARLAADAAARRIDEEPEPTLEQLDEEVANAGLVDLPIAAVDLHDDDGPGPFSGEVPAVGSPAAEAEVESEPPDRAPSSDERRGRKRRKKGFDGLPAGELTVVEPPAEHEGVRILAEPVEPEPVEPEPVEPEPEALDAPGGYATGGAAPLDARTAPFAARRAALGSVEKELARRLKRVLADEQNEVLDLLRRAQPGGVDALVPVADEHAARWADVVAGSLGEAAAAGADWSGGTPSSVADLADELARGLTGSLRERIDRSFVASDGNLDDVADRVRALYREWKGQRLIEASSHFLAAAYARGVLDGVAPGALVQWVVDPEAGPCPDCDDNVLAGQVEKGSDFPTGNPCAPAHPGCHCLVLP